MLAPYEVMGDGRLRYRFDRHRGQWRAWVSLARFVAVISGTQGGKTSFGPLWLHREIQERGPGDYLVATPTFPLLEVKALPEFRRLFEDVLGLGRYVGSPIRKFTFSEFGQRMMWGSSGHDWQTAVYFGHAASPDSLESATYKAAWLDECGQKAFKLGSWEAILRRLSIWLGRALLTTTPYFLNWLKTKIWDRRRSDPDIEVVNFRSIDNPAFPREEYERARRDLPEWKFRMFYKGLFTRPAGLIYDSFDERRHVIRPFAIPDHWPRYLGLDYGGVNTAAVFVARRPGTKTHYLYREYKAGGRTAKEHAEAIGEGEPDVLLAYGGAASEDQWRREFRAGGLAVKRPLVADVELGIDRVYGGHKRGELFVFESCSGYLDEKATYSRVLDGAGEPTDEIENKHDFHFMDAERYVGSYLFEPAPGEARSEVIAPDDPLVDMEF